MEMEKRKHARRFPNLAVTGWARGSRIEAHINRSYARFLEREGVLIKVWPRRHGP